MLSELDKEQIQERFRRELEQGAEQDPRFNHTTTKREMFAAMAMQGLLACSARKEGLLSSEIAKRAVNYAEVLLAELQKEQA